MNILIIPDIHGRSFWEKAINDVAEHRREFDEIVFLGDYFDPYSTEHINECQAIMNWEHLYDTLFGTYLTCVPVISADTNAMASSLLCLMASLSFLSMSNQLLHTKKVGSFQGRLQRYCLQK